MRKRTPGFYVRVDMGDSGGAILGRELLDGPWASPERARIRAAEIMVQKSRPDASCSIVRVERDGTTVTPVEDDAQ